MSSELQDTQNKKKIKKDKDLFDLKIKEKFLGFRGETLKPSAIILKNNNLHLEIIINPKAFSAAQDAAGISDIIIESAISTGQT